MANRRNHYNLIAFSITYKQEDRVKIRQANFFGASAEKHLNFPAIKAVRDAFAAELVTQTDLKEEDLIDLTITAISYLGYMSDKEWNGGAVEKDEAKRANPFDA